MYILYIYIYIYISKKVANCSLLTVCPLFIIIIEYNYLIIQKTSPSPEAALPLPKIKIMFNTNILHKYRSRFGAEFFPDIINKNRTNEPRNFIKCLA